MTPPGFLGVSHGEWATPVPSLPSDQDLFLLCVGGVGTVRVKVDGTHEVLKNNGSLLDAGMGQNLGLFGDQYTGSEFRYAYSADGGESWVNGGVIGEGEALPGEVALTQGISAGGVLTGYNRTAANDGVTRTARVFGTDDGGASAYVLEQVTITPPGALSGTHLQSVGHWSTANATGIWWGIEQRDYDANEVLSHLRKTPPVGGGAGTQISLAPFLSSPNTSIQARGMANHDDSDSALFHTSNGLTSSERRLFKVVGTTVTDLMSALNNSYTSYDWWGSNIYVGSQGVIKKSTNGGSSFTQVFAPVQAVAKLRVSQTNQNIIVAILGSGAKFCYTIDGGSTWTEVDFTDLNLPVQGYTDMVVL